jgi:competence protein ComEA
MNRIHHYRIETLNLVGLAAFVLATTALTSHASAQRRSAPPANTAEAQLDAADASDGQGVVNIQTASLDELQRLPGIGPSKAAAIVAQRERAAFRRVEDIMRVRGIGRATFRRLRSMLTVSGPTTLAAEVRSRARPTRDSSEDEEADDS